MTAEALATEMATDWVELGLATETSHSLDTHHEASSCNSA